MSMSSEEWHQRSNLIPSQNKFIIWRVIEKSWHIWSYKCQSTDTWLKQNWDTEVKMSPIWPTISAPHCSIFLWASKERTSQDKRSLLSLGPLKKSLISSLCIIIPIEIVDISVFNKFGRISEIVKICFSHRLLKWIKASGFIHIIPNMNIRVSENVIISLLTYFHIFRSINIQRT